MPPVFRVAAVVVLLIVIACGIADAQQRVALIGSVQWTSANRVQLMTDSGVSVNVDVSRIDQGDYSGLRSGDRLRIVGYLAPDRIRVIAEALEPDTWSGPQTP
jgi:hypothetical protein